MSNTDPYTAPSAELVEEETQSKFALHEPRTVSAGRGVSWFSEGFEFFKMSPGIWIAICIIGLVLMSVFNIIPWVNFVMQATFCVWTAGLMIGIKALHDGESLQIGHLFAGFKSNELAKLLAVGAGMTALSFGLSYLVIGINMIDPSASVLGPESVTSLLLGVLISIALLLPVTMAIWFAPLLIVLNKCSIAEALKLSFMGCLKNILPFLLYGVVGLVLLIVGIIPIGLGLLIVVPMFYGSLFASYKDIFID